MEGIITYLFLLREYLREGEVIRLAYSVLQTFDSERCRGQRDTLCNSFVPGFHQFHFGITVFTCKRCHG